VSTVLLLVYCLLILAYRKWFRKLRPFQTQGLDPATGFSIIIPARNEAENIGNCLQDLLSQNYPAHLVEIIVINDHSTDDTAAIVQSLIREHPKQIQLIDLEEKLRGQEMNAYKKKAIEIAIGESRGEWIVTTDADCRLPNQWLALYDAYIQQHKPVMVAGPVMFTSNGSIIQLFQLLDFMSLQGITAAAVSAGSHTMCNGANLAYRKDVFYEVGQFAGIDQLASGDDMLLMYKIKQKYPQGLGYLFNRKAIVRTAPMFTWKQFINQRIRWASKADRYKDRSIFWVLLLVYLLNLSLLILLPVNLFVDGEIAHWLTLMLIKTLTEMYFLYPVSRFYGEKDNMLYFPFMQPLHLLYTVVAGWLGKFGTYQWKGRKVR
jgi:cellulose synthase/poly-beta-1,6-N-acetylglucosamine synthase-like glycosyltransferase